MDVNKFKKLSAVKVVKTSNEAKTHRTYKKRDKAPRAIKCEVLFSHNHMKVIVNDIEYPLIIHDVDYENAEYAYSSKDNPYWDLHTLKKYKFRKEYINHLRNYWVLVIPKLKVYVTITEDVAYLDMERMNKKMIAMVNKLKPSYYADRIHTVI